MINLTKPSRIRYRFIEKRALDFFKTLPWELLYFPLNMEDIIKCFSNCRLWSYQHYADKNNVPIEDVIAFSKSKSGCTHYDMNNNRYLIMYNDANIDGRILFTIAHEIGHIFLKHFECVDKRILSKTNLICIDNDILEHEADYFASCIASPFPLYKDLNIQSCNEIMNTFGLSKQASQIQLVTYQHWRASHFKTHIDNDVKTIFSDFLKSYNEINHHC